MPRRLALLGALPFLSCRMPAFDAVLVKPMYGWTDGCNQLAITGRGFGPTPKAAIADLELQDPSYPEKDALEFGYAIYGTVPASATGEKGWADVTVTSSDGEKDVIKDGYYYVECPRAGYAEALSPDSGVSAGDAITLSGCSLEAGAHTVMVGDAAGAATLTGVCGTAIMSFEAPAVSAEGSWYIATFDAAGTRLFPDAACDITIPVGSQPPGDTADTGWSDPCAGAPVLTYGGAR